MELTLTKENGYTLATIKGDLIEDCRAPFREQLHPIIREDGSALIIDLSQVGRTNSAGISNMVNLVADANTHSSQLIFAQPSPFISNVLQITRLNTYFTICESMADAIQLATTGK